MSKNKNWNNFETNELVSFVDELGIVKGIEKFCTINPLRTKESARSRLKRLRNQKNINSNDSWNNYEINELISDVKEYGEAQGITKFLINNHKSETDVRCKLFEIKSKMPMIFVKNNTVCDDEKGISFFKFLKRLFKF